MSNLYERDKVPEHSDFLRMAWAITQYNLQAASSDGSFSAKRERKNPRSGDVVHSGHPAGPEATIGR